MNVQYKQEWADVCLAIGDMHDYAFGSRVDLNDRPVNTEIVCYTGV